MVYEDVFNKLKFDDKGLIPAVVIDEETKRILTLAYMNKESMEITLKEGRTCFWSRSRQELWRKGETSGNVQYVKSIVCDCDYDALAIYVDKTGPACHLGNESCFEFPLYTFDDDRCAHEGIIAEGKKCADEEKKKCEDEVIILDENQAAIEKQGVDSNAFSLDGLYNLLQGRKAEMPQGSYTTYLFEKGIDKILKKIGEESTEVIIAGKAEDKNEAIYEIGDLAYHVMVLMVEMGISVDDIRDELASRHIIDKKVKQERMT